MVVELQLTFKDEMLTDDSEPMEFTHTLSAPEGFAVTGGSIFVENSLSADLKRFAFRVDKAEDGTPSLTILEDVSATA